MKRFLRRLTRIPNLHSHAGVDGAMGFIITFPFWWLVFGIVFVLCYWLGALALNTGGVQKGTFYQGAGLDGAAMHREIIDAGLGGYAEDYDDAESITKLNERAFIGRIDRTVQMKVFPAIRQVHVRAASISREERFYPWTEGEGWE